jgi:hypothetical protein
MLIGGEIIARLFLKDFFVLDEMNMTYRYDEELGWFPIASSTKNFTGTRPIQIVHNADGFRDREHGEKNKKRIVFLGDSFVWGYDVEFGERFTEYLQQRLSDWEIINLGISGYSTDHEFILIQKYFDHYQPEVVFLVVCDNDFKGNSRNIMYGYYKPYFVREHQEFSCEGTPVSKGMHFYSAKYPLLFRSVMVQYLVKLFSEKEIVVDDMTDELYKEMQAFVESKGARFFIGFTDDAGLGKPCETCEINGIPYVNLTTDLRFQGHGKHWTPEGNKYVSEVIYDFLVKEKLVEKVQQ